MKAMRHETRAGLGTSLRVFADKKLKYSGITLVELLVVVTIMSILLAISVPAIKPMLETQKTRDAADSVSSFLAQARLRAIETGLPCGVRFERYIGMEMKDSSNNSYYPYNGACLQMRQVAVPRPYGGCVEGATVEVIVNRTGGIVNSITLNSFSDSSELGIWNAIIQSGDSIQFDHKGPKYKLSANTLQVDMQDFRERNLSIPDYSTFVPFKVYRQAKPTLVAPVRFPQGVVVDLNSSGKQVDLINAATTAGTVNQDDFRARTQQDMDPVVIMFLPNGEVDKVSYANNSVNPSNDPIFLCVGLWDRMGNWSEVTTGTFKVNETYRPDDKKWNFEDLNNFWVTVFPKSGTAVVQPMASVSPLNLNNSRFFARDQQGIGGR